MVDLAGLEVGGISVGGIETCIEVPAYKLAFDIGRCPPSAASARQVLFTHSHIDHVNAAEAWADADTEIWATDALGPHMLKQYGIFQRLESLRGRKQFGHGVPDERLPCSALGRRIDPIGALDSGMLFPTHTFSGQKRIEFGGVKIDLIEALNRRHFARTGDREIETRIAQYELAFRMQSSVPQLTDISGEPRAVRLG